MQTLALTDASRYIAGVLLLTVVGVEFGGTFLLRIHRGEFPFTEFQKAFARAPRPRPSSRVRHSGKRVRRSGN